MQEENFHVRPYWQCGACRYVVKDRHYVFESRKPCPNCGDMDGTRFTWPGVSADQYVTIISRLDGQTTAELSITLVLLCAYAEFLLEIVLQDILRKLECPEICAQLILDHRDRFKVFKGLTGVSVESGFRDAAEDEFYPVWSRIRRERNRFAHGWPQVPGDDNIAKIRKDVISASEMIEPAFVSLSNYFVAAGGSQAND